MIIYRIRPIWVFRSCWRAEGSLLFIMVSVVVILG